MRAPPQIGRVAEHDRVGRDAFLRQYGFAPARDYVLVIDGREYDSKAIAGVAHKYARRSEGALHRDQFSGGEASVARTLRKLGFDVVRRRAATDFREADSPPALALPLHGETSRKAAYDLFKIEFDQRKRHLTRGLSPRLPDIRIVGMGQPARCDGS